MLPQSHAHDSILCSTVADVDWDGSRELLLGTYGKVGRGREGGGNGGWKARAIIAVTILSSLQRVLAYKLDEEGKCP